MRNIIAAALLAISPIWAAAQKNSLFADIGMSGGVEKPGVSATYNRQLAKHFGAGIGGQVYTYSVNNVTGFNNANQTTRSLFGDLRGYLPINKSLFFLMTDLGMDFYKGSDIYIGPTGISSTVVHHNGFYTGFGIGYCYRMIKRGMGPYISVKIVSDTYKVPQYNPVSMAEDNTTNVNATSVISIGFKF